MGGLGWASLGDMPFFQTQPRTSPGCRGSALPKIFQELASLSTGTALIPALGRGL